MASLADKNLSQQAQDEINQITADAQAGKIKWADANKAANEVRAREGADYTVGRDGTTTYDDGSTISSFKTGSKRSGGKASGGGSVAGNAPVSAPAVVDPWADMTYTRRAGAAVHNPALEITKAPSLAGQSVKIGDYTVTFDERGYARRRVKDGGASATGNIRTAKAYDSADHLQAYQAAMAGDWDTAYKYINRLGTPTENGEVDMTAAKQYAYELQNEFGYDADQYYNQRYDEAYGGGSAATWDATNGAVKTYQDLLALLGNESAQQVVGAQIAGNPAVYTPVATGGETAEAPQFGADADSLKASLSVVSGGGGNGISLGGDYDLSELIRAQKESELEKKLASLKSAFDKSESALDDALERVPQEYDSARNEAAAQYAIAQRAFDERAVASGLNSGTTGQAALARNSVLQKNLSQIAQNEANAISDIELQRAQLIAEYQAAIEGALAEGEAELAAMLYEEMVRVQNLEREDAMLAAQQAEEERELALKYAAEFGVDPNALIAMWGGGGADIPYATGPVTNPTAYPSPAAPVGNQTVDNGGLPSNAIRKMQAYFGADVDGSWGPASRAKAGNKSATDAWNEYITAVMPSIEQAVGMNRTSTGQYSAIRRMSENGEITEDVAEALLEKFGLL